MMGSATARVRCCGCAQAELDPAPANVLRLERQLSARTEELEGLRKRLARAEEARRNTAVDLRRTRALLLQSNADVFACAKLPEVRAYWGSAQGLFGGFQGFWDFRG